MTDQPQIPISSEVLPTREAAALRVRELGATRFVKEKSVFYRFLYWNGRDQVWITVKPTQKGGFRVEIWKSCPC